MEVFISLPSLTLAWLPVCFARRCLSAHRVSEVDMHRNDETSRRVNDAQTCPESFFNQKPPGPPRVMHIRIKLTKMGVHDALHAVSSNAFPRAVCMATVPEKRLLVGRPARRNPMRDTQRSKSIRMHVRTSWKLLGLWQRGKAGW